jgi:hypothetical protein
MRYGAAQRSLDQVAGIRFVVDVKEAGDRGLQQGPGYDRPR